MPRPNLSVLTRPSYLNRFSLENPKKDEDKVGRSSSASSPERQQKERMGAKLLAFTSQAISHDAR